MYMFYVKLYVHSLVDEVILPNMFGATIRFTMFGATIRFTIRFTCFM